MKDQILNRNQLISSWPGWLKNGALIDLPDALSQQNQQHPGLASFGESRWGNCPDESKISYYLPNFFLEEGHPGGSWLTFENNICLDGTAEVGSDTDLIEADTEFSVADFSKFDSDFKYISREFESGKLDKVVAAVRAQASHSSQIQDHLIRQLLIVEPGFYNYGFWLNDQGIWGKTPELLAQFNDGVFTTMALAGTRLLNCDKNEFLNNEKERGEHQIVVDEICRRWRQFSDLPIEIGPTYVHEISPLMHLRTDLKVNCSQMDLQQIVNLLHPTPALGVQPMGRTDILKKVSPSPRGRFGAPFGVHFNANRWFVVVAIRNFELLRGKIAQTAGCGIVSLSDREQEKLELKNKLMATRQTFGMRP